MVHKRRFLLLYDVIKLIKIQLKEQLVVYKNLYSKPIDLQVYMEYVISNVLASHQDWSGTELNEF